MVKFTGDKPFFVSNCDYRKASVILVGAPLDATGSFRAGTKFAPAAVRAISWTLEDYDIIEGRAISEVAFFDTGDIFFTGDLKRNLGEIESLVRRVNSKGKKTLLIGGEPLVTYAAVKALSKIYPELNFIVFDAHTDLGDPARKMKFSHATTTRLVFDLLGRGRIFLFGARSGLKGDVEFARENFVFSRHPPEDGIIESLVDKPVYISIDIDVLDPSVAPGVTTPEVLGWRYETLYETLSRLSRLERIVGGDVTEICPAFDPSGVTALIGASLVRKLLFLLDGG